MLVKGLLIGNWKLKEKGERLKIIESKRLMKLKMAFMCNLILSVFSENGNVKSCQLVFVAGNFNRLYEKEKKLD